MEFRDEIKRNNIHIILGLEIHEFFLVNIIFLHRKFKEHLQSFLLLINQGEAALVYIQILPNFIF